MNTFRFKMLTICVAIMLIAVAIMGAACSYEKGVDQEDGTNDNQSTNALLGSFTTTDLDGNVITQEILEQYDLIVLNVWGTFCGPCLREMPDLGTLAEEYASQKLAIIGLISDTLNSRGVVDPTQVELARSIVESTGADYLHLLPSSGDDLAKLLREVEFLPTTYFLTSQGVQVGEEVVGSKSINGWRTLFDEMLGELDKT